MKPLQRLILYSTLAVMTSCGGGFFDSGPKTQADWRGYQSEQETSGVDVCQFGEVEVFWTAEGWGVPGEQPHRGDRLSDPRYKELCP